MTLHEYFALPDTPMPGSPVGHVIAQLVEKRGLTPEAAYVEAKQMLVEAAGRKRYRAPRVLTIEQQAAADTQRDAWLARVRLAQVA